MQPRVVCLGEILIDFVSTERARRLADAPAFEKAAGGAPANVAAGVAKLGVASAFLGKVGADPFGGYLAETMQRAGVDISGLVFDATARTTLAFVSLAADGDRDFVFYRNPGADELYAIADVRESLITGCEIFHFGSVSMTGEPSRAATLHAARLAREAGKIVSFDPNLRLNLWSSDAREAIAEAAVLADIVKVSEEEMAFLPPGLAPKLLLVTRGAKGCTWKTAKAAGEVGGFAVAAVDTTGAGDAFVAAMLAQILENGSVPEDAGTVSEFCRFANAAGALATTRRGAIPALPGRTAIVDLLQMGESS